MELIRVSRTLDFVGWSRYGLLLSLLLTVFSAYLFFSRGFSLGIDFAGGSVIQIRSSQGSLDTRVVRDLLNKNSLFRGSHVSELDGGNEVSIKTPYQEGVQIGDLELALRGVLVDVGSFETRRADIVGPKVGRELAEGAVVSLLLATVAMMLYVSFRYEWRFALAGIVALVHDVAITASSTMLFGIDLSLEVVAALLTLLGYSINDTIIIFDRIRERMLLDRKIGICAIINEAISNTLARTLLTSLTMFLAVLTLYLFGGDAISGFSLVMLVGVVFGTYSSMFVAPKLAVMFGFSVDRYYSKEMARLKKEEERKRLRQMYEGGLV